MTDFPPTLFALGLRWDVKKAWWLLVVLGPRPDNSEGPCHRVPVGGHDCGRPLCCWVFLIAGVDP